MSWLARAASQAKNFTSGAGSHTRIGWPDGAHPCVAFLVDLIEFGVFGTISFPSSLNVSNTLTR